MKESKVTAMLNEQFTKELFSAYLYLAIANFYSEQNLNGFSNWFEIQAHEELDHAMLFRQYLLNNDFSMHLAPIECPIVNYTDNKEGLTASYSHELMITASINQIYYEASSCMDYRTVQFLDWFVKEQGEEEKNANDLCKKFDIFCKTADGLYLLDCELGTRVYSPPTLVL